jgi:hypothetical protein
MKNEYIFQKHGSSYNFSFQAGRMEGGNCQVLLCFRASSLFQLLVSLSVLKNDGIYITRGLRLNVTTDDYHDSASKCVFLRPKM